MDGCDRGSRLARRYKWKEKKRGTNNFPRPLTANAIISFPPGFTGKTKEREREGREYSYNDHGNC